MAELQGTASTTFQPSKKRRELILLRANTLYQSMTFRAREDGVGTDLGVQPEACIVVCAGVSAGQSISLLVFIYMILFECTPHTSLQGQQ